MCSKTLHEQIEAMTKLRCIKLINFKHSQSSGAKNFDCTFVENIKVMLDHGKSISGKQAQGIKDIYDAYIKEI